MKVLTLLLACSLVTLSSCTDSDSPPGESPGQPESPGAATSDHGDELDLGILEVAGKQFKIVRLGELVPGQEGAFEVHPVGMAIEEAARWNLYLWVEEKDGTQVSAPSKGLREGSALHFHVSPRAGSHPMRVVLRVRMDGLDERAGLPLDGHGHEHFDGPHGGIPAGFSGGEVSGKLELKLHDDKGDLELWLFRDEGLSSPFDLPLASEIEIEFIDVEGRKITLRPRNVEQNEDEDGKPNVRDGKTNYFIYPSRDGEDASWLQGKNFQSIVIVRFAREGQDLRSEEFVLKPHVH